MNQVERLRTGFQFILARIFGVPGNHKLKLTETRQNSEFKTFLINPA